MNNELPKTKIDERTGIEYNLEGDYYIPNLAIPKQEKIILNMHMKGYTLEQIAECVEKTIDEVEAVIEKREPVLA